MVIVWPPETPEWLLFEIFSSPCADATFNGANDSWLTFWPFIVIILAGENENIPADCCGDAVNIVCCEPAAVDSTKKIIKKYVYGAHIFMHKNSGFFSDKILISLFFSFSEMFSHPDVRCRMLLLADYNEKKSAEYL